MALDQYERQTLRLLKMAPFQRRAGGWRFGTKRIAEAVIDRLVESGIAMRDCDAVTLADRGG